MSTMKEAWTPEKKAEQSRRASEAWAKKKAEGTASRSTPSKPSAKSSSLPPLLPRSAAPSGPPSPDALERMVGMLEALAKREAEGKETPKTKEEKKLPDDPGKRDRVLQVARPMARLPVAMVDELCRTLEQRGLTDQEREEGIEVYAALLWYYGLTHPLVGVLFWTGGVVAPRVSDALIERKRKRQGLPKAERKEAAPKLAAVVAAAESSP